MSKHTPGPWTQMICTDLRPQVTNKNGLQIVRASGDPSMDHEANASRIVACVNACEGIDNPAALQDFIREAYKLMLRCDRDEGMQSDGSNMSTLDLAMSLESLGVSSKIIEEVK